MLLGGNNQNNSEEINSNMAGGLPTVTEEELLKIQESTKAIQQDIMTLVEKHYIGKSKNEQIAFFQTMLQCSLVYGKDCVGMQGTYDSVALSMLPPNLIMAAAESYRSIKMQEFMSQIGNLDGKEGE